MIAVLVLLMAGLVSGYIVCPDGTECEDRKTCCPTQTGYACCQYPSAVCCPDKTHCCPEGYQCDTESQLCEKKGLPWSRIPLSPQIRAEESEEKAPAPLLKSDNSLFNDSVVHCDNIYICPDYTTCCRNPFGQWHCCIYNMGQCCLDGIHCCPFGYHCDSTSTHCYRGTLTLPASSQIAALQSNTIQDQAGIIHCSDRFYCPAGTSCCKILTGQWACCPYPLGQCCKDGKHCCEYGYDCNSSFTKCKHGSSSVPALHTKKALIL